MRNIAFSRGVWKDLTIVYIYAILDKKDKINKPLKTSYYDQEL